MLQLIDLAVKQRETLIATSASSGAPKSQLLGKDFCGYDYRLDTVGATAAFTAFVKTPLGESILRNGRLPLPGDGKSYKFALSSEAEDPNGHVNGVAGTNGAGVPSGLHTVMCVKKKCKPHAGWSGIHTKNVKHQIKELAAQAKEKLDFEARIRDCAAVRYQRRKRENNRVVRLDGDVEMED
jgi:COMPASS component SPP1